MNAPIETLMALQDELLGRLMAGRVRPSQLAAVHDRHVRKLTKVGYRDHEASACFWDAVHTARATTAQERGAA